jgi:hypothetical protein
MSRGRRHATQLLTPPKSLDGASSCDSTRDSLLNVDATKLSLTLDTRKENLRKRSAIAAARDNHRSNQKTRVLRRRSSQHVTAELRAFFAISPLPATRHKHGDSLSSTIGTVTVSSVWDNPGRDGDDIRRHRVLSTTSSAGYTAAAEGSADVPLKKHWLTSGLYVGPRMSSHKSLMLSKVSRESNNGPMKITKKFKFSLPIYYGEKLMERQRDFQLPWNFYATMGRPCKPPNWTRIKRSTRYVPTCFIY